MDPNVLNFLISFFSGVGANLTTSAVQAIAEKVFAKKPGLEKKLSAPTSATEFQSALNELAGAIEALAGTGSITIDGGVVEALRLAKFDHQSGTVSIRNSRIQAPIVHTGGSGSGTTQLGDNTELRSAGTSIKIGNGASITISGNAGIKQT